MKKIVLILMACLAFSLTSCSKAEPETPTPEVIQTPALTETPAATPTPTPVPTPTPTPEPFAGKIALVTNDNVAAEDEYRSGQQVVAKYGEDKVVHVVWPLNFMQEWEQMIRIVTELGEDPEMKAIIINQSVPGTIAAIDKLKAIRDDIFVVCCVTQEHPSEITKRANLVLNTDELMMGPAMVQQAQKLGAEVFVHYSFPRHLSQVILSGRRELIEQECDRLGIQFVDATAPDPTSEVGVAGAQQFILDDVPKMISKYGKDAAFFNTNCAMQIPLIKAVADGGAIYPQPCCPSPYHGFISALDIDTGEPGTPRPTTGYIIAETKRILAEKNMTGRMSTWPDTAEITSTMAGAYYAVKWINGEVPKEGIDLDALAECIADYAGVSATLRPFMDDNGTIYDNSRLVLLDYITY